MSTLTRDKRKAAQRNDMNRRGVKFTHATRAETLSYVRYLGMQKQKRTAPLVTDDTVAALSQSPVDE